jgi:hypothetical protein
MEIGELSDSVEFDDLFDAMDKQTRWNGRNVHKSAESVLPNPLPLYSTNHNAAGLGNSVLPLRAPTMARPPDESKAEVIGGYNDKQGLFVEGKWTWSWGSNTEKDPNTADTNTESTTPTDPPDSRDKDQH